MRDVNHMRHLYSLGWTLEQIAGMEGISKQAVSQALSKLGVSAEFGGRNVLTARKSAEKENAFFDKWKITKVEGDYIKRRYGRWPFRAFTSHVRNSRIRNIEFLMTFQQWWNLWQESGKWDQRGRGGYVMARFNDSGPYQVGNVRIATQSENTSEYHALAKARDRYETYKVSFCRRGHAYDEKNTYLSPIGERRCRTCKNIRAKKYRASGKDW